MGRRDDTQRKRERSLALPHDERALALRPEVLLARGKCELQEREEQAVRGAVQDAIATYRQDTTALAEQNHEARLEMAARYRESTEEAEEILFRECAIYDPSKCIKYRNLDCEKASVALEQENARLQNVLNNLIHKRIQGTAKLMELQKRLAAIEMGVKYEVTDFPEEEERLRKIGLKMASIVEKTRSAKACQAHYQEFIRKLGREKWFYDARVENMKQHMRQDLHDMEVCHDILVKGEILEQDAQCKRQEMEAQYREEKRVRANDDKCIRKEVSKKDQTDDRRIRTSGGINIERLLQRQQNMKELRLHRQQANFEVNSWKEEFEELQVITRTETAQEALEQFQNMDDRNKYLERELETLNVLKQSQQSELDDKCIILSSVKHAEEETMSVLQQRIDELQATVAAERERLQTSHRLLETTGAAVAEIRNAIHQQLRSLKFVSRPQGWERKPRQEEAIGDVELLRFKIISLQQRFDTLGAPYRMSSKESIQNHALATPNQQIRVRLSVTRPVTAQEEEEDDKDDEGIARIRTGIKKHSIDLAYTIKNRINRSPKK